MNLGLGSGYHVKKCFFLFLALAAISISVAELFVHVLQSAL